MSKLPAIKPAELARIAKKLGFVFDRQKGSHAIYLHPVDRRRVVIPMHNHDLKTGTLHGLLKDLGISGDELIHWR
jgi:predicted RNA binding protein YcfA (HicA-like mRNA interferase family)